MSFGQLYFSFQGRIDRSTYWLKCFLPIVAAGLAVGFVDALAGAGGVLFTLFQLALIWPSLAINAKRFHDRGKSGWWNLIALVPLLGALWILVDCGILPGTPGPNRFGPAVGAQAA